MTTANAHPTWRGLLLAAMTSLACAAAHADPQSGVDAARRGDTVAAIRELHARAEHGDRLSQLALGDLYMRGAGAVLDDDTGGKGDGEVAAQGQPQEHPTLDNSGEDVTRSFQEAARWYRLAAAQGLPAAQYRLGMLYANGQGLAHDAKESESWIRKAAEGGFAPAEVSLGVMYATGAGLPIDPRLAISWYEKAASQSDASGQNNLGWMLANGLGVARDDAEALRMFRLSASAGNAFALNNLGWMYEEGRGVPKDAAEAQKWYRLAEARGNAAARNHIAAMTVSSSGTACGDRLAQLLWRQSPEAIYNLGWAVAQGMVGCPADPAMGAALQAVAHSRASIDFTETSAVDTSDFTADEQARMKVSLLRFSKSIGRPSSAVTPASRPIPAPTAMAASGSPPSLATAAALSTITPARSPAVEEITSAVRNWAQAWSARDLAAYTAAYKGDFKGNATTRQRWLAARRSRILPRKFIHIEVSDLEFAVNDDHAQVHLTQMYESDVLHECAAKVIELVRDDDGNWRIEHEGELGALLLPRLTRPTSSTALR